jgi:hypothetical protein
MAVGCCPSSCPRPLPLPLPPLPPLPRRPAAAPPRLDDDTGEGDEEEARGGGAGAVAGLASGRPSIINWISTGTASSSSSCGSGTRHLGGRVEGNWCRGHYLELLEGLALAGGGGAGLRRLVGLARALNVLGQLEVRRHRVVEGHHPRDVPALDHALGHLVHLGAQRGQFARLDLHCIKTDRRHTYGVNIVTAGAGGGLCTPLPVAPASSLL